MKVSKMIVFGAALGILLVPAGMNSASEKGRSRESAVTIGASAYAAFNPTSQDDDSGWQ